MAEILLLRESGTIPTEEVLENALGKKVFAVYEELIKTITGAEFELAPEWNYYKDGKAWLCKVIYRKKTVFWLSAWENHIKTSFYFTEKTRAGIFDLTVDEKIKQDFIETKAVGKLNPLILCIDTPEQLEDLKEIIRYKKGLK